MCIIGGEFIRNKEDTKCIADKHNVLNQIILGAIKDSLPALVLLFRGFLWMKHRARLPDKAQ
jgi:hypothetical protein